MLIEMRTTLLKVLTSKHSLAFGRFAGSFTTQNAMKSLNVCDHSSGFFKVGGGLLVIRKTAYKKVVS
jgi:hypothetical protein